MGIARMLNQRGVTPPCTRRAELGLNPNGGYSRCQYEHVWEHTAISDILGRMDYIGHTVSMKLTHRSYKDKRVIEKPEDEWIITRNTQEPIVDEKTWNTVQRIRKNGKRRKTSLGEMGPLNGLWRLFLVSSIRSIIVRLQKLSNKCNNIEEYLVNRAKI